MTSIRLFPFFLLSLSPLAAQLPSWVENPSASYDEGRYESFVGAGASKEYAEKEALAGLARKFGVHVYVSTGYRQIGGEEGVLDKELALSAQQDLFFAKIAESASDGSQFYALALVERAPAAQLLRAIIKNNEVQLAEYNSRARWEEDKGSLFNLLKTAEALAEKNERCALQLDVLIPGGEPALNKEYSSQYFRARSEALAPHGI